MVLPVPLFVVVSGPPASGKSSVAPALSRALGLPLLAKDDIKDALMSVLPVTDVDASRQVGRAAVAVMFALAATSPVGAVIESNLVRSVAVDDLRRLGGVVVEVFCRCPRDVALARFRARTGSRAAGHLDHLRTDDEIWNAETAEPVAGGWPVVELDTTQPVDLEQLLEVLAQAVGGAPAT